MPPADLVSAILSSADAQSVVNQANEQHDRDEFLHSNTSLFVLMQARVRGKHVRERYLKRKNFLKSNEDKVVTLQRVLRGMHMES